MRFVMTKGLVMFLCRDLRSCHTVTVNLTQPRRVSKNIFAPGGGPAEAVWLVREVLRDVIWKPKGPKGTN